jgi:CRISPR-associated protein Cmr5
MITREQTLAATIYDQVCAFGIRNPLGSESRAQYGSMAHKLPILVRTAGLVQALAFVASRGKEPHRLLMEHLAVAVGMNDAEVMLAASRTEEIGRYMHLTSQVMLALKWYKRFAQSVLNVEPTQEEG